MTAAFTREQAGATADAIRDGQGDLATKADLAALEARIDIRIAGFETRMVKFGFGLALGNAALIVGLLRLFGGAGQ